MHRNLILLTATAMILFIRSGPQAEVQMANLSPAFASEEAAVKAAADIYNPVSIRDDREFIGAVFLINGEYFFNVEAGGRGRDSASIRLPAGALNYVAAFWHTHGRKDRRHRYFSDVDTAVVRKYGKPFYLADYTGLLKVFRPGARTLKKHAARQLGLPARNGYAQGARVRDPANRVVKVRTAD